MKNPTQTKLTRTMAWCFYLVGFLLPLWSEANILVAIRNQTNEPTRFVSVGLQTGKEQVRSYCVGSVESNEQTPWLSFLGGGDWHLAAVVFLSADGSKRIIPPQSLNRDIPDDWSVHALGAGIFTITITPEFDMQIEKASAQALQTRTMGLPFPDLVLSDVVPPRTPLAFNEPSCRADNELLSLLQKEYRLPVAPQEAFASIQKTIAFVGAYRHGWFSSVITKMGDEDRPVAFDMNELLPAIFDVADYDLIPDLVPIAAAAFSDGRAAAHQVIDSRGKVGK